MAVLDLMPAPINHGFRWEEGARLASLGASSEFRNSPASDFLLNEVVSAVSQNISENRWRSDQIALRLRNFGERVKRTIYPAGSIVRNEHIVLGHRHPAMDRLYLYSGKVPVKIIMSLSQHTTTYKMDFSDCSLGTPANTAFSALDPIRNVSSIVLKQVGAEITSLVHMRHPKTSPQHGYEESVAPMTNEIAAALIDHLQKGQG